MSYNIIYIIYNTYMTSIRIKCGTRRAHSYINVRLILWETKKTTVYLQGVTDNTIYFNVSVFRRRSIIVTHTSIRISIALSLWREKNDSIEDIDLL